MNFLDLKDDAQFMQLALSEAEKCEAVMSAFCVGCVLTARWPSPNDKPVILSCGYSRELPGNTHAEANALSKARELDDTILAALFPSGTQPLSLDDLLENADVYTTLEPCSVRTSGLSPCADALIAAKIRRCIIGVGEPDDFVKCEGAKKMKEAGIEIVWLKGFEQACLEAARRGHGNG